jgi:hypothetical protein
MLPVYHIFGKLATIFSILIDFFCMIVTFALGMRAMIVYGWMFFGLRCVAEKMSNSSINSV